MMVSYDFIYLHKMLDYHKGDEGFTSFLQVEIVTC